MIILPTSPGTIDAIPRVLDFGAVLEPGSGARTQRLNRMGNRYGVAFQLPPLKNKDEGRVWVNRLVRGQQEGARIRYPLLDFNPGTPGAFVVNGSGQAGKLLNVRGGTPGYQFKEGQPFNVIVGGEYFLDFIAADVTANGSGNATITLSQMLRVEPTDGAALAIAEPMIEGWVMGEAVSWRIAVERTIGISFEIHEAA
ncbi:hypothetical protein K9B33_20885 [Sphingobium sp. 3R8]|uniref:hypothetical protein n=1 Tax=Sphingobium sp. 3R8 TaxID=2874921 RepID=UPI001CCA5794|nr:hypothetical protein [Sphingobium sp. 3R8]MBZ9649994.1 hypothetical protein [Sphingobium sp. 3R8]